MTLEQDKLGNTIIQLETTISSCKLHFEAGNIAINMENCCFQVDADVSIYVSNVIFVFSSWFGLRASVLGHDDVVSKF